MIALACAKDLYLGCLVYLSAAGGETLPYLQLSCKFGAPDIGASLEIKAEMLVRGNWRMSCHVTQIGASGLCSLPSKEGRLGFGSLYFLIPRV